MSFECFECAATIGGEPDVLGDRFLEHARSEHDWPYPDQAIRNYAEATLRLTGSSDRLDEIGEIVVQPVTLDRIDDWLNFFDRAGFVGTPEWAACYCLEPHKKDPVEEPGGDAPHWRDNRSAMASRLSDGGAYGYLAYVDGVVAGWVNASKRLDYSLYRLVDPAGPNAADVIGVSCFLIAPPFRRHGVASVLLDRVIADATDRGADWVEGYPHNDADDGDSGHYRGPRSMYSARGFDLIEVGERYTVMRLATA